MFNEIKKEELTNVNGGTELAYQIGRVIYEAKQVTKKMRDSPCPYPTSHYKINY